MSSHNVETQIENLVEPIINKLGYELYDVQYLKEGKDFYLRITIDKEAGIGIEDCETVNHAIDDILDEADVIKNSYFLEVSSPGIERILRKAWQFEKQIGNTIYVKLYKAEKNKKELEGILKAYQQEILKLEVDGKPVEIETKNIALARVAYNIFEEGKG